MLIFAAYLKNIGKIKIYIHQPNIFEVKKASGLYEPWNGVPLIWICSICRRKNSMQIPYVYHWIFTCRKQYMRWR